MKKIDPKQLNRDIEAIPSICEDSKDAIRRLFENNFGVEFDRESSEFKTGAVYTTSGNGGLYMLVEIGKNIALVGVLSSAWAGTPNHSWENEGCSAKTLIKGGIYVKVADSPEEYFKNKIL